VSLSQVTFIYIALYTIQIVSKQQLYSDNRKTMHFGCLSAEVSSLLIQISCKDDQLSN